MSVNKLPRVVQWKCTADSQSHDLEICLSWVRRAVRYTMLHYYTINILTTMHTAKCRCVQSAT